METPLIITANGNPNQLGRTLATFRGRHVEPIVVPSGEHQAVREVAERFGANVTEPAPEGLAAIQAGLHSLGERATEKLVALDVNARPLSPNYWLGKLLHIRSQKSILLARQ